MADPSRPTVTATGYPATTPYPQSATNNGYPYPPGGYPPPANGYPYQPNQAYYYPYTNTSNYSQAVCLRRFFAVLITLSILLVTISFIMWLALRPRVPEFTITSASVSNLTLASSNTQVTGNWVFTFSVKNPNKKVVIHYERVESSLWYKDAFITETVLEPFDQGAQSEQQLKATYGVSGSYVKGEVGGDLGKDKEKGNVGFDVRVFSRVKLDAGIWRIRRRILRVLCEDVRFAGFTNGTGSSSLSGGNKGCKAGV